MAHVRYILSNIFLCISLSRIVTRCLEKISWKHLWFHKEFNPIMFYFSRCKFDTKEITVSPSSSFASNPSVKCRAGGPWHALGGNLLPPPHPQKEEFGRDRKNLLLNTKCPFQIFRPSAGTEMPSLCIATYRTENCY